MGEPGRSRSGRGPGVFDWLLLIAATAVAMGFVRVFFSWHGEGFNRPWKMIEDMMVRGPVSYPIHINYWVHIAAAFVWCWTLALIPIRIRRPRPPWRRMMRQPGAVACLAALIAMLVSLAAWGLLAIPGLFGNEIVSRSLVGTFYPAEYRAYAFAQTLTGHAIATVWGILALSRRWRPEPSWIDRAGRFLGFVWLIFLPVNLWATLVVR